MDSQPAVQGPPLAQPVPASPRPPSYSFAILFTVCLLSTLTATLVTFILPESFSSTARIKVERDVSDITPVIERPMMGGYDPYFIQTEFEVIQSARILHTVISNLNLNVAWAKKFGSDTTLKTDETFMLLRRQVDPRPVRNTSLIEIRVYSDKPDEAATIANEIAETYKSYRLRKRKDMTLGGLVVLKEGFEQQEAKIQQARLEVGTLLKDAGSGLRLEEAKRRLADLQQFRSVLSTKIASEELDASLPRTGMVEILDGAVPALAPVRPNKPLNIALGIIVGLICGVLLATVVYVLQRRAYRRALGISRTQLPLRIRAMLHIAIALAVGVVIGYRCAIPMDLVSFIMAPLAVVLGGCASAYIEFANLDAAAAPRRTEPPLTITSKY